jgi:transposase
VTLEAENAQLRQENSELRAANEALQARVAELEQALAEWAGKGKAPSAFVKANKPKRPAKQPRQKRAAKYNQGRRREQPTRIEQHRLARCANCGEELSKYRVRYRRQVIDIPEPHPVEVVEHQVEEGWCAACRRWHTPAMGWPQAVGKGRIGVRLRGLVGYMRSILRLPFRQIQAFLQTVHRVRLSVGELVHLSRSVEQQLDGEVTALQQEARSSPTLHMDETGWREDGQNGYIWCLVTDTPRPIRYFAYSPSRASPVVAALLGNEFAGILVSDFYSAYNVYPGRHQRCWVHLLRDLSQLRQAQADDPATVAWCVGVKNLYYLAQEMASTAQADDVRQANVARLMEMTRQLGLLYAQRDHPCRALAKRLLRHMDELFLFVRYPGLSADNNLAERALRSLVVQRKVSGGSRTPRGSQTCMRLASLFQTWLARGLNPLHQCWRLLGYQPSWAIPP